MKLMKLPTRMEYNLSLSRSQCENSSQNQPTAYIFLLLCDASIQGRLMACELIFQSRKT
jgi:hypothetical protein